MTLNNLKGLQMGFCVPNNLSEVNWSHLRSFGVVSVMRRQKCNAAQKCTALFLSVSTTDVRDSAPCLV